MTSKLIVSKHNQLIHASYSLSISEQRILLLCLAKLDSRVKVSENQDFLISVDDLAKEIGVEKDNAYRDLRVAVNRLWEREIKLDADNPDSTMRWLYKKAFFKSNGTVVLNFSPPIIPFISELKERFTSYKLKDVAKFQCVYSLRIYELLMQYKNNNELVLEISHLRNLLELNTKYERTTEVRRQVIQPAVNDINKHSNLNVTFSAIKAGRGITHFLFNYDSPSKDPEISESFLRDHARVGESREDATKRLLKELKDMLSE